MGCASEPHARRLDIALTRAELGGREGRVGSFVVVLHEYVRPQDRELLSLNIRLDHLPLTLAIRRGDHCNDLVPLCYSAIESIIPVWVSQEHSEHTDM